MSKIEISRELYDAFEGGLEQRAEVFREAKEHHRHTQGLPAPAEHPLVEQLAADPDAELVILEPPPPAPEPEPPPPPALVTQIIVGELLARGRVMNPDFQALAEQLFPELRPKGPPAKP